MSDDGPDPGATSVAPSIELSVGSPEGSVEGESLEEEDWNEGDDALVSASHGAEVEALESTQVIVDSDSEEEGRVGSGKAGPAQPLADLRRLATPQNKPPDALPLHTGSYESMGSGGSLASLCHRTEALHISRDDANEDFMVKSL